MTSMHPPANMTAVTQDQFFALLYADRRDIMPRNHNREFTTWEVVATRAVWGWSTPGWASAHGTPKAYAVRTA